MAGLNVPGAFHGMSFSGGKIGSLGVEIKGDTAKLRSGLRDGEKSLRQFGRTATVVGGVVAASFTLMTKSVLTAAISFDKMMRGLNSVAGGAEEAQKQLRELREVAKLPGLGLQEAVQGSIRLQAVGFSAKEAVRELKAIGNALATVGAGRQQLQGVILALTQMKAKGKIAGDDLRQMANWLPQIRKAMMAAFGTGSTEAITAMGISVEEFIDRVTTELEKLPKVSGGIANALENLNDEWRAMKVELGTILLPVFESTVSALGKMVEFLKDLNPQAKRILAWALPAGAALGTVAAALGAMVIALPSLTAGFATLAGISLGPLALTVGGVATGIAAIVLGLRELKDAQKDTFFASERKAQNANIAGIKKQIQVYEELKNKVDKFFETPGRVKIGIHALAPSIAAGMVSQSEAQRLIDRQIADLNKQLRREGGDIFGVGGRTGAARPSGPALPGIGQMSFLRGLRPTQDRFLGADRSSALKPPPGLSVLPGYGAIIKGELKAGLERARKEIRSQQLIAAKERMALRLKSQEASAKGEAENRARAHAEENALRVAQLRASKLQMAERLKSAKNTIEAERQVRKEAFEADVTAREKALEKIKDIQIANARRLADIANTTAGIFEDLLHTLTSQEATWERFFNNIKSMAIRTFAEIVVSQAFQRLSLAFAGDGMSQIPSAYGTGASAENESNWLAFWNADWWPFAEGGIATKPTKAIIGEKGPEAVIPLDKASNLGGNTYNVNLALPNVDFRTVTDEEVSRFMDVRLAPALLDAKAKGLI